MFTRAALQRAGLRSNRHPGSLGVPPPLATADDSALPFGGRAAYRGLADELALFVTDTSRDTAFPSAWAVSLYSALIYLDGFDADPDWKSVRDFWRREVFDSDFRLAGRRIVVATRKEAKWTEPWKRGVLATGDARVDALIEQFGFEVADRLGPFEYVEDQWDLTSQTKLHPRAVAALWRPLRDVEWVAPDPRVTLYAWGNAHGLSRSFAIGLSPGLGWQLRINYGWGDCFNGCINGHTFAFTIGPAGNITLSHQGDPIPTPLP